MRKSFAFILIPLLFLTLVSCKNETSPNASSSSETIETPPPTPVKKKDLSPQEMERLSSVMSQLMLNQELKKFASYCVTAGLTEMLSSEKGPYTIFAPSNQAYENLAPENREFYSNQTNRVNLEEMLKSHIVLGTINKNALVEGMGKNGKTTLKTLAGTTLTITQSGENFVVSTEKDRKAQIISSDILGSNGVVYVIDGVLRVH